MYGYLADVLVCIHVAYVGYVVLGQLAIILGAALRAEWARNPWFRWTHLLAIAIVGLEVAMNWQCPLTTWEFQLRSLANQAYQESETFMGRIFDQILFWPNTPQIFFNTLHIATLVVVAQAFLMYPPRKFRWRRTQPTSDNTLSA